MVSVTSPALVTRFFGDSSGGASTVVFPELVTVFQPFHPKAG
ncbi:hypothetical protein [Streptomyces sp. NPDC126514]